jgi:tRNA pseudouridine55 synthase
MNIVINLNKPENISSQQAVTKVKRLFAAGKAGHAGTLDPIATGVLIVCLNEATKITRFLSALDKEYVVRLKLGERTDTYDLTGRIIEKKDFGFLHESDIHKVLSNYKGQIMQTPPMYSAIKKDGIPLYELARKGISIERPGRMVHIYAIELLNFDLPYLDLRVSCSKGTYIRTLCEDIGNALGIGAHMVSLKRTKTGKFKIENSVSLEELKFKKDACYSIDSAISHFNEIILDENSYQKAKNGVPISFPVETLTTIEETKNIEGNPPTSLFVKGNFPIPPLVKGGEWGLLEGGKGGFDNLYINQYVRLKNHEHKLFGIGKTDKNKIKIERLLN